MSSLLNFKQKLSWQLYFFPQEKAHIVILEKRMDCWENRLNFNSIHSVLAGTLGAGNTILDKYIVSGPVFFFHPVVKNIFTFMETRLIKKWIWEDWRKLWSFKSSGGFYIKDWQMSSDINNVELGHSALYNLRVIKKKPVFRPTVFQLFLPHCLQDMVLWK